MIDNTLDPTIPTGIESSRQAAASNSDVVISVHNVGKMYRLYDRPQDRLKEQLFWRLGRHYGREFWALRDVSFEVRRGERFGIIGRNGAGKSTLLQMLAGIFTPTVGEIQVRGRVAALLELGSGFNPEFTGRENVFMNGTVLGLSPAELEDRFNAIAEFADIGDFIEQPTKLYSSGMLVRLAFAVATHVDAEVLLIDEALAVGDVFFRQKCYQQLDNLRERGVSIILVSHTMMEVEQFCQQALLVDTGKVLFQGAASEAVKRYYLLEQQDRVQAVVQAQPPVQTTPVPESGDNVWPLPEAFLDISGVAQVSNGWARCIGVAVCDDQGRPCSAFQQGEMASFFYEFELLQNIEVPIGGLVIQSDKGVITHGKSTLEYDTEVPDLVGQGSRLRFRQDIALEIMIGAYSFEVGLAAISRYDYENRAHYTHSQLRSKIVRMCHLPAAGQFTVTLRRNGTPVQLLHHGVANLPGECRVTLKSSNTANSIRETV